MIVEKSCWVYKVINNQNGDFYFGITTRPTKRWNDHVSHSKKERTRFYNAIQYYGKDAFSFHLLEVYESTPLAKEREIALIAEFDPEYNSTGGGDGMYNPTPEVRAKMSAAIRACGPERHIKHWQTRRENFTPEEISAAVSKQNARLTPEQRAEKSRKLSQAQANRTTEAEAERQRKRAETVAARSPEEQAAVSANLSEGIKARVLSEESQRKISEGQVQGGHLTGQLIKSRLENMSEEDKAARMENIVKGIKQAAASRTQEQKDAITAKRLASRERNKVLRLAQESQGK